MFLCVSWAISGFAAQILKGEFRAKLGQNVFWALSLNNFYVCFVGYFWVFGAFSGPFLGVFWLFLRFSCFGGVCQMFLGVSAALRLKF